MKIEFNAPFIWDLGNPKEVKRVKRKDYQGGTWEDITCVYSSKKEALEVLKRLYTYVYPRKSVEEFEKEIREMLNKAGGFGGSGGIAGANLDYLTAVIEHKSPNTITFTPIKDLEYRLLDDWELRRN